MGGPVAVLKRRHHTDTEAGEALWFWCPGCDNAHNVNVSGPVQPIWEWDRNLVAPTISPSILVMNSVHLCGDDHRAVNECPDHATCPRVGHAVTYDDEVTETGIHYWHGTGHSRDPAWGNCHSFLRTGVWEFLGDSAHHLAGQSAPMVPLPDWLAS